MVGNDNFEIPFLKGWDWSRFYSLVSLRSPRGHLDTPSYLVGYVIIMADKVLYLGSHRIAFGTR